MTELVGDLTDLWLLFFIFKLHGWQFSGRFIPTGSKEPELFGNAERGCSSQQSHMVVFAVPYLTWIGALILATFRPVSIVIDDGHGENYFGLFQLKN